MLLVKINKEDLSNNLSMFVSSLFWVKFQDNKLNNNTSSGVTANSNLKYSFMIGDSFSSNVTSTLDLQCLISTLIVTTMLLSQ